MRPAADRVWLITGASSGLGRALAEAAAAGGATVVAATRRPSSRGEPASASGPGSWHSLELDVTDEQRVKAAVAETIAEHGRIDVLVNSAGAGLFGAGEEVSGEQLRDLMDLHFFGPIALTRAVLPQMRASGGGTVVQMSSQAGCFSVPGLGGYSATKFALEGWSEALAAEVGQFNIRVLIVEPGPFRTPFYDPAKMRLSEAHEAYAHLASMRRDLAAGSEDQPGDPALAATAILAALEARFPPLRLALGNEAVDQISRKLDDSRRELELWESISRGADANSANPS